MGEYVCKGDDGRSYSVVDFQEFTDASTKDGEDWLPGRRWLELPSGSRLIPVDNDTFRIRETGVLVVKP